MRVCVRASYPPLNTRFPHPSVIYTFSHGGQGGLVENYVNSGVGVEPFCVTCLIRKDIEGSLCPLLLSVVKRD